MIAAAVFIVLLSVSVILIVGNQGKERSASPEETGPSIDKGLIYLYFQDINKRIERNRQIEFPQPLQTDSMTRLYLALAQKNTEKVPIQRAYISFPPNTTTFSGVKDKVSWQSTGRRDANELFVVIGKAVGADEEIALPPIDILFKHGGLYTISYMISLEGGEVVADDCTVNVTERIR